MSKFIHRNVLIKSSIDTIQLGHAVEVRFVELTGSWLRIMGVELIPPQDLDKDMLLWRTMSLRHQKADFRNSLEELQATRRIAQWTVNMNCQLRNQPIKQVEWSR